MEIDAVTLADLEFRSVDGRPAGMLGFLDRTVTDGGRRELEGMLRAPLSRHKDIVLRQQFLRELSRHRSALPLREFGQLIDRVERYVNTSFVPLPTSKWARAAIRLRYTDMLNSLTEGISAVGEFLALVRSVGDLLEAFPLAIIEAHRMAEVIRTCVELPVFIRLDTVVRATNPSRYRFARFDAPIRDDSLVIDAIHAVIETLHQLDALQSLAVVSAQPGWNYPEMIEGDESVFEVRALVHPLVPRAVANDLSLVPPACLLYVTGPNMAGKTTFMKACAIAVVFAHLGMAIPAASGRLSVCDRVFAALTVRDSLRLGESFFLSEVRRVKALAAHLIDGDRVFAVIDEMFKGTNVLDARDSTSSVVHGLSDIRGSLYLVSSHLADLASQLERTSQVALASFDGASDGETLIFSYRLTAGYSEQRLGVQILEAEGVLRMLGAAATRGGLPREPGTITL